ncbi:hypothetical protein BT67DRAFT_458919 [Trichocladium antarcticum]|uniref:PQ loop repeat protein n=1 Tax=Trichocladium antarcticum TaxID=1450529 RepID=A0AAN6ZAC0_9PEZI|nr:hypothetical protein BT67DRAFT_458919 [Trichocladium antarcticum]
MFSELWCVQLIPQIWTNWRTKRTDGLPGIMMFLWALCAVPFGVYAVVQNFNIPLQVQPQVFMSLCLVSWTQTLLYHNKWPAWKATFLALAVACVFAGAEAALILTLRPVYYGGNDVPMLAVGIIAAVLLAAGLLPPYRELWKRRGRVVGINWAFLFMDWLGAFVSLMALVAQKTFDTLGGASYMACCLLEIGIASSHLVWLARTRKMRRAAAAQGKTFDDIAAEHEALETPFKFAERKDLKIEKRSDECGDSTVPLEIADVSQTGRDPALPLSCLRRRAYHEVQQAELNIMCTVRP